MQTITFLIPVYNNASTIGILCDNIQQIILKHTTPVINILLVDDASTDESFEVMKKIQQQYSNVSILQLSYNHTQQYAFFAAAHYIKSDFLIYISADLQEDLLVVQKYLHEIEQHTKADLIIGFREQNNDFLIFRILSKLFYKLIKIKLPNMPEGGFDTGCVSKVLLQNFIRNFKRKDLVQATLLNSAVYIKLIPYTRLKSSSDGLKIKSLIFKIKYFIFSLMSVYSLKNNTETPYFSVKQYLP